MPDPVQLVMNTFILNPVAEQAAIHAKLLCRSPCWDSLVPVPPLFTSLLSHSRGNACEGCGGCHRA